MRFFISRPTREFPLAQGIKNTGKPQREGTHLRTTRLLLLIAEEHISNWAAEDAAPMSAANLQGNDWGRADRSQLYAFGAYVKFNEQRTEPRTTSL